MKLRQRFTSSIAALLLMVSAVAPMLRPLTASAFAGQGGSEHPYLLTTCEELQTIGGATKGDVYWLANDINCNGSSSWDGGKGFKPIEDFEGTLDGRGHSILNIDMNRPDEARVGLFAVKEEGLVANLSIDSQSTIIGGDRTGSFFGSLEYARA